jgi:hypothetical protein
MAAALRPDVVHHQAELAAATASIRASPKAATTASAAALAPVSTSAAGGAPATGRPRPKDRPAPLLRNRCVVLSVYPQTAPLCPDLIARTGRWRRWWAGWRLSRTG